jgi:hypothetical protein
MSHENSCYRSDIKFLRENKLPLGSDISQTNGGNFTHPFVCGNFSSSTSQAPYQKVFEKSIYSYCGFKYPSNKSELESKNSELRVILKNKNLECKWSMWWSEYYDRSYWGPNGNYLKVI